MDPLNRIFIKEACLRAAKKNDFEELKWAFNEGCILDSTTISYATKHGNCEIIEWALENGCKKDSSAIMNAALVNNFKMVDFLLEKKFPMDEYACSFAALGGNFEMLQYLRSKNCPWDERTLSAAACKGRRDIIKWSHNHGCKHKNHPSICESAAECGQLECLKWLIEKVGYNYDRAYRSAKMSNQDEVISYLKKNRYHKGFGTFLINNDSSEEDSD